MLKAKIDTTMYPIVRVDSKEKLTISNRLVDMLEFDPSHCGNHGFLLYFREMEDEQAIQRNF